MPNLSSTHPDPVLRPLAPPLETTPGRKLVHDEAAVPGRAVGLVVDEALVREHLPRAAAAYADGAYHGKPCEVSTSQHSPTSQSFGQSITIH